MDVDDRCGWMCVDRWGWVERTGVDGWWAGGVGGCGMVGRGGGWMCVDGGGGWRGEDVCVDGGWVCGWWGIEMVGGVGGWMRTVGVVVGGHVWMVGVGGEEWTCVDGGW